MGDVKDKKEAIKKIIETLKKSLEEIENKIEELLIFDWEKKKKIKIDDTVYTVSFTIKKRIKLEKIIDNHFEFYNKMRESCKTLKDFKFTDEILSFISIMYNLEKEETYNILPPSNFDLIILLNALLDIYYYDMKMYEIEREIIKNQLDYAENILIFGEEQAKKHAEEEKEITEKKK